LLVSVKPLLKKAIEEKVELENKGETVTEDEFIYTAEAHFLAHLDSYFKFDDFEYDLEIE
jgi:hypothetical protein